MISLRSIGRKLAAVLVSNMPLAPAYASAPPAVSFNSAAGTNTVNNGGGIRRAG